MITQKHHEYIDSINFERLQRKFEPPKPSLLARLIHHPDRQEFFVRIRYLPLVNDICSRDIVKKVFYATGLSQDVFSQEETRCDGLNLVEKKCTGCGNCAHYCPLGLNLPEAITEKSTSCIHCLYCYLVCPTKAIEFIGELGFMNEQIRQYDEITRRIV